MPRILSLNDQEAMTSIIDTILRTKGYESVSTMDSHEALSILRQDHIDLFTQDILRPDMNGFALYWRMKAEEKLRDIPILIISGWDAGVVNVTPTREAGRKFPGLFRAEFEGVKPDQLTAVDRVKDANVLDVEGYVRLPCALATLLDEVERILSRHFPLTEEERALRLQHLWSRATEQFRHNTNSRRLCASDANGSEAVGASEASQRGSGPTTGTGSEKSW